ncbi:MAG: hypothetical protein RJA36_1142 [Pseudomonadota bacterium]|jgi:hypothetical protein
MTSKSENELPVRDWMQRWADLESQLARWLAQPRDHPGFRDAMLDLHGQLAAQLDSDTDSLLYWLVQRVSLSSTGYSATHALLCASLCHLVAPGLGLSGTEREHLTLAALTMNLAMTQLQDQLAAQAAPLSPEQRALVERHAQLGAQWLAELGVHVPDWLHTVAHHHDGPDSHAGLLPRILAATDRYAALISPREHRGGRCVTDSARQVIARGGAMPDAIGQALLQTVGLCPPGTFVRLEDGQVAVVLRRGRLPAAPWVLPLLDASAQPLADGDLLDTTVPGQQVAAALIAATVPVGLDHERLLRLSYWAMLVAA